MALLVALSVGLLAWRLTMIYAAAPSGAGPSPPAAGVSEAVPAQREDAELFDRALAAGLLRLEPGEQIAIAPADLPLRRRWTREHPELLAPRGAGPDWLAGAWDDEISRLHRMLHFSPSGRYVRRHIDLFNARRPEFPHIRRRDDGGLVWRDRP